MALLTPRKKPPSTSERKLKRCHYPGPRKGRDARLFEKSDSPAGSDSSLFNQRLLTRSLKAIVESKRKSINLEDPERGGQKQVLQRFQA